MTGDMRKMIRRRVYVVAGLFVLAYLAAMAQGVRLQVIEAPRLTKIARKQTNRLVPIPPRRGVIYDRHLNRLAVSAQVDSVFVRPKHVADPVRTAKVLAPLLSMDRLSLYRRLKSGRPFWLKRRIGPKLARRIGGLKLAGVVLQQEPRRFYPHLDLAAHVIGFAGADARGLEGVELKFDRFLRGRAVVVQAKKDALGRTLSVPGAGVVQSGGGLNLVLTIDSRLQYETQRRLARTVGRFKAKGGVAVVVDPFTGAVLAWAVHPGFNPNAYLKSPKSHWRNRIVTDTFEPGSTLKVFLAAAALDSGRAKLTDVFDAENGATLVADKVIRDPHPRGKLTFREVIKYSSNIGALKLGRRVGDAIYYRYLRRFGFGRKTGVDLPGEVSGTVRHYGRWRPVEAATMAFGQGMSVTALQLAMALSAIANGGNLMRPFVVSRIVDSRGRIVRRTLPEVVRRVISRRTASLVRSLMLLVTAPGGTGRRAAIFGVKVAGKTGTAQKAMVGRRGYQAGAYISSFIGFAPADSPRAVAVVILDEPRKAIFGGVVAAPTFARIMSAALSLDRVYAVTPAGRNTDRKVKAVGRRYSGVWRRRGSWSRVKLELASGRMPDLRGMSLRRALRVTRRMGVSVSFQGSGWVVVQRPAAGSPVGDISGVYVKLASPEGL